MILFKDLFIKFGSLCLFDIFKQRLSVCFVRPFLVLIQEDWFFKGTLSSWLIGSWDVEIKIWWSDVVLAVSLFVHWFGDFYLGKTWRLLCALFVLIDKLNQVVDKLFVMKTNLPLFQEGLNFSDQVLRKPAVSLFNWLAKVMLISEVDIGLLLAAFIDDYLHPLDIFLKTIVLGLYCLNCLYLFMMLLQLCC